MAPSTVPAFKPTEVSKVVEPLVDEYNLLLVDRDPDDQEVAAGKKVPSNEELLARARDNTQFLFNKIWALPHKILQDAVCVELPQKEVYRLPREKPVPGPKVPTRWEAFAKSKGIKKQPKAKKVYDAETDSWKPTYGYRRANDETKDWMLEVPDNEDPNKDFFGERIQKKKERVARNEYQQMKNEVRANKLRGKVNNTEAANIPLGIGGRSEFSNKTELTQQIHKAKHSTASLGKFQPELKGEQKPKTGKKRKFEANEQNIKNEKDHQLHILNSLSAKKPKLNENRFNAVEQAVQKQEKQRSHDHDDDDDDGGVKPRKGGRRDFKGGNKKPGARGKSNVHRQQHFEKMRKGRATGGPGKSGRGGRGGGAGGGKRGGRR